MSEENNNSFEAETKKTANEFKESWNQTTNNGDNKKILAGVLGIFFGHIGIHKFIGKKPVFASGNSDGDLQMMQWTASGDGSRFNLYVHHTDSVREWAYDRESHIGKLDKGLDLALEEGWTVVNMASDWNLIYSFEKTE